MDAARWSAHDHLAPAVDAGTGGLYALVAGDSATEPGVCTWFDKPRGLSTAQLLRQLRHDDAAELPAVWQRQLVLGPAPEFRIDGQQPPGDITSAVYGPLEVTVL